jgi:O-antigen ligase
VICIALLTVAWLISPGFKNSFRNVYRNKILLLLVLFYDLHILSLLYSENLKYAFFDLEVKLSFLLFPFILSAFAFSDKDINRFKNYFIGGALLASMLCLIYSLKTFSSTHDVSTLFYTSYSRFLHPAYFTIYLSVAQLFLLELFFTQSFRSKKYYAVTFIAMLVLWLSITLLSSRTAYVTSILITIAYMVILFSQKKINTSIIYFSLLLIITIAAMQLVSASFYNRYTPLQEVIQPVPQDLESIVATAAKNSTTTHYLIWENTIDMVKRHPLIGVGIGDIHDELNNQFIKNNYELGMQNNFNPHNQFLNAMVSLGIAGVIILLALFGIAGYLAWKSKEWIFFFFLAIIFLNCLTESVLERQAGVIFFSFFLSLFAAQLFSKKHQVKE